MKIIPIVTLVISLIIGLVGLMDLTQPQNRNMALFALVGAAVSGGALAVCASVDRFCAAIAEYICEKEKASAGSSNPPTSN